MGYYKDKIKVVCPDKMCFPVDPVTLDALACSTYDPYPYIGDHDSVEIISYGEWCNRRNSQKKV